MAEDEVVVGLPGRRLRVAVELAGQPVRHRDRADEMTSSPRPGPSVRAGGCRPRSRVGRTSRCRASASRVAPLAADPSLRRTGTRDARAGRARRPARRVGAPRPPRAAGTQAPARLQGQARAVDERHRVRAPPAALIREGKRPAEEGDVVHHGGRREPAGELVAQVALDIHWPDAVDRAPAEERTRCRQVGAVVLDRCARDSARSDRRRAGRKRSDVARSIERKR